MINNFKMKKNSVIANLALILTFITGDAFSQNFNDFKLNNGIVNDYKAVESYFENIYPEYKAHIDNWYTEITNKINNNEISNTSNRSVLEIPVVVHVVWKNPIENLSQGVIQDQIDILNKDFQRQNSDTINMRSVFSSIAGNPQIKFNLIHVQRINTSTDFFATADLYDDVKTSSTGGSDAWNTDHYLNIWIANLKDNYLLGYAYPPAGAPGWSGFSSPGPEFDGVVIDYRAFGPSTSFLGIPLKGRTAVHEVGHYLGLRHIWGDGDCSQDDNVADTPISDDNAQFACDKTRNSCNEGPGDLPDLIENFMDYSSETCQNTFTKGQATLMRTVLQTYRPGLLQNVASIDINHNTSNIKLYPNPSTGIIFYNVIENNNPVNIEVIDFTGKIMLTQNTINKTGIIDLTKFEKGIYVIRFFDSSILTTQKVTLQ